MRNNINNKAVKIKDQNIQALENLKYLTKKWITG